MAFEMNRNIVIARFSCLSAYLPMDKPLRRLSHRWWRPRALIAMMRIPIRS